MERQDTRVTIEGSEGRERYPDRSPGTAALSIEICSTFTADPIRRPLGFWMHELGIDAEIGKPSYAQVLQDLLDPASEVSRNRNGLNLVLVRLQDWAQERGSELEVDRYLASVRRAAVDFLSGIAAYRSRSAAPLVVVCAPSSSLLPADRREGIAEVEREIVCNASAIANVHCFSHEDVARLYPVSDPEDVRADDIGHIPYKDSYFVALATLVARRIAGLLKPRHKVIAIDCDNTLWKGICGEDGAGGVELTPAHIEFQNLLVQQHDAGILLCLCSKNNPADVEAVFRNHPEMPLRQEHLISSRVNWEPKSANLLSLAGELNLGIDSFMLVDDSPMECAEVQSSCPSVLALQFPTRPEEIEHFTRHLWAFDRVEVTEEGRRRTQQYREIRSRNQALEKAESLAEFLASLELQVSLKPMKAEQLPRVAELVQRTNQFNLTAIRRHAMEIETRWSSGELRILICEVRDRFGDYGLVGAVLLRGSPQALEVDTFVLSCRVLGRGVEYRIVNELGRTALAEAIPDVILRYRPTARNVPARTFVQRSFARFADPASDPAVEQVFRIPADYAASLGNESRPEDVVDEKPASAPVKNVAVSEGSRNWHAAALRLTRVDDIVDAIQQFTLARAGSSAEYVAPRNTLERAVADIWAEVLGLEQVSVQASFFDLGGDSIRAVQAIARIESVLGREIPVYEFFNGQTVEQIVGRLDEASQAAAPIPRVDRRKPLPVSWAQQRLWFIDQLEGSSSVYYVPIAARLKGELDHTALQAALDMLLARHEVLRTVIAKVDGEPVQQILPELTFALFDDDLRAIPADERERRVRELAREELARPFDLAVGPLVRGRLLRITDREHVLLITMHHIVSDGWSVGVVIREIGALYAASKDGRPDGLPRLSVQYADYAQWQREWLAGGDLQNQLAYWKAHLDGAPELLELPTDRPRPAVKGHSGASCRVDLDRKLAFDLRALSRRHNVTLAMTLMAAWTVLLSRLSRQDDIVFGMPVANRRRTELEDLVGFFVNTLAVRVQTHGGISVGDLLQRVKESLVGAYANQDAPFEQVVEVLRPTRRLSHSPIFQVMFVLLNAPRGELELPGLTFTEEAVEETSAQFDLRLTLQETSEGIVGRLNYSTDLFDGSTIERWIACFEVVLAEMARAAETAVECLPLMREAERAKVLYQFNDTDASYPADRLVHEMFEEQVRKTPDNHAVLFGRQRVTFDQLNRRANQLARELRAHGIGPDRLVGLCMERSLEMIVALLGILKAGGAYLPLDPDYPAERLSSMLADAAPSVVLCHTATIASLPETSAEVISIDRDGARIGEHSSEDLDAATVELKSHHLCYVIYTSGSTGKPNGVMIEHRNLASLWQGLERIYAQCGACERVAVNASFSFDASVKQLVQLLSGRTLVLVPQESRWEAAAMMRLLDEQKVDAIDCTPWQLRSWIDAGLLEPGRHSLRMVLVGGEPIDADLWSVLSAETDVRFYNVYGPTESTVDTSFTLIDRTTGTQHIGRPMENRRVYVLDRVGAPVPIGVVGEIYIGGAGVARGYLNRAELTASRFSRDPFSVDPGARMYKSGDLARWRPDGTIEYVGRNDHQVKLHGFRIELNEIEAQLLKHPGVKDAVASVREDAPGEKRLVAYITHAEGTDPSASELRTFLKTTLPDYMIPAAFVRMTRIELTSNGKVDRNALPVPELAAFASEPYEPPHGATEQVLASVWQTLLKVERIGRQDNFFELGGHSLLIVRMIERLRRVGLGVRLRQVFENPRLVDLAAAVSREAPDAVSASVALIPPDSEVITPSMVPLVDLEQSHIDRIIESVPGGARNIQDIYPLTPLQEGILFHHMLGTANGDTYVVPTVLSISSRQRLDELIAAIQSCIDRYDVLRTAIFWDQLPRPIQVVYRQAPLHVSEVELDRGRDVREQLAEWVSPEHQHIDLHQAPLIRLRIARDPNGSDWYALIQVHHIVDDATSQAMLISEVVAQMEHRSAPLAPAIPYRDHVVRALASGREEDAEVFFRSKLADVDEPVAPFGILDVHVAGANLEQSRIELNEGLSRGLRVQARRAGVTTAALFHAAWALVVAHTSGRDDVVFGSVLLGRLQNESAGGRSAAGLFINTLPLRLKLQGLTAAALLDLAQSELLELLGHEQASLALAQRCSGIPGTAPLFTTLLNYRHSVAEPDSEWSAARGVEVLFRRASTNYPITASVDDFGKEFALTVQTDRRIDAGRVAGYLNSALRSLVDALEGAPGSQALDLRILPAEEYREVVGGFNDTGAAYPPDKLIHRLFEEQVRADPRATAVVHDGVSLSYEALNARANQLARHLRAQGLVTDEPVGVCLERSPRMIVGLLAILKAGGAYMPLDPNYPPERLRYMVEDAQPKIVLTQSKLESELPLSGTKVILLDHVDDVVGRYPTEDLGVEEVAETPRNLLYLIYTSGSTGRPKGTGMPHRAMVNLIEWHRTDLCKTPGRRVLQFAALSFDVAFQEIFSTLCCGNTLVLLDEWVRKDPRALLTLLGEQSVDMLFLPPLMLQTLAECAGTHSGPLPETLRDVITAGEQLRVSPQIVRLFQQLPEARLHNHYGPTETHVVTSLTLSGDPAQWPALPSIGRPVSNTQIYVLDRRGRPVPIDVTGEIFIAGDNVARGYLGRPELTAERFVKDPFSGRDDARMYKTGDVGRWRADGSLDYLGRNDDQVKIRGYRIELGEVEARVAAHAAVREAAVVVREERAGDKRLVAYVTLFDGAHVTAEELRDHMISGLPEFMVPNAFMVLDSLPLTPSGKLNRRILPAPEADAYVTRGYEAPEGETEQVLASVWQAVLNTERVGRHDNFFEIGGHSLDAMRLVMKVEEQMGVSLSIVSVFQSPTIGDLAKLVESSVVVEDGVI